MFDLEKALESGYSEDEVMKFLSDKNPSFDIAAAKESGYSPQEISQFLSQPVKEKQEEKGLLEKGARIAGQFALGAAESAALPYEMGAMALSNKDAMAVKYRENVMDDIERLQEQKNMGVWDEKDQVLLDNLVDQIKNPQKSDEFVQTMDVGVRDIAGKLTGQDLKPEGFLEKTANIIGFIKDPRKLGETFAKGLNPKQIIQSIMPSGKEVLKGVGMETGATLAEEGQFGPIGTMAAIIAGDLVGEGVSKGLKSGLNFAKNPKQYMAEVAASFTSNDKKELQKDIIESFRRDGIQADLGTITDSNLIKMTQARLAQSSLVGKDLENFKKNLIGEIKESYQKVANTVGELKASSSYEAGLVAKETVKSIQKKELENIRGFYKGAEDSLKESAYVNTSKINSTIQKIESNLSHGQLKSQDQKKVLEILDTLKRDVSDSTGKPIYGNVKDLMNNKVALGDLINYEIQGGTKSLLKEVVADLDRAIISHGKENPRFAKEYVNANKKFSEHAKTFRNKDISSLLKEEDPAKLLNRMNSIDGIKKLEKILNKTPEGKKVFSELKRTKLEDLFANSMVGNIEEQIKLGTFSNALSKGKNKEIAREILGKSSFDRLQRLQKNTGALNESIQKFINTSQSGTVVADTAAVVSGLSSLVNLLSGNIWPFVNVAGGFLAVKGMAKLMTDPHFLKMVEDVVLANSSKDPKKLWDAGLRLAPYFKYIMEQEKSMNEPNSENSSSSPQQ